MVRTAGPVVHRVIGSYGAVTPFGECVNPRSRAA